MRAINAFSMPARNHSTVISTISPKNNNPNSSCPHCPRGSNPVKHAIISYVPPRQFPLLGCLSLRCRGARLWQKSRFRVYPSFSDQGLPETIVAAGYASRPQQAGIAGLRLQGGCGHHFQSVGSLCHPSAANNPAGFGTPRPVAGSCEGQQPQK
jgi:hypothetical protein